jgi:hypothetical protein
LNCFLPVILLLQPLFQVRAQAGAFQWTDVQVEYQFGDHLTFMANIEPKTEVQEALVFFQADGESQTLYIQLQTGSDGNNAYKVTIADAVLRPFAKINFWFRVTNLNGQAFTSPQYYFYHFDNRMTWQTMENPMLSVHWYEGDTAFGQGIFDIANASLQNFITLIPVKISAPVDVYVYRSSAELQSAIGSQWWIAGHASLDLGVVLVSIAPGEEQAIVMQRQIPHEIAHMLLYRYAGTGYNQLPSWLNEGIASLAELTPPTDYKNAVQAAGKSELLLPLSSLCGPFPADASGAFLAHAESDRVTRYIQSTYGTSSLDALVLAYAKGLDCEQGAEQALGISLSQLDRRWRQAEFGRQAGGAAFQNLLPYLFLMLILLVVTALVNVLPKLRRVWKP